MKAKLLSEDGEKTFAVIFDSGDDCMEGLQRFAVEHGLTAAKFTAIGAFSEARLAYFRVDRNEYMDIPVPEQVEVLSLIGDVALKDGEPVVHAHAVLGKCDGSTIGGHLLSATVRPTLEVVLVESPRHLRKKVDQRTGLALIDLDA